MIWRNIQPYISSVEEKAKQTARSNKLAGKCMAYSSALKIEGVLSSKTLIDFYLARRHDRKWRVYFSQSLQSEPKI
jgi:hypothetical protein